MKHPVLIRLAMLAAVPLVLSGCYYAIPTVVEAVYQNRLQKEADGALPESATGALKLVNRDDAARDGETQQLHHCVQQAS